MDAARTEVPREGTATADLSEGRKHVSSNELHRTAVDRNSTAYAYFCFRAVSARVIHKAADYRFLSHLAVTFHRYQKCKREVADSNPGRGGSILMRAKCKIKSLCALRFRCTLKNPQVVIITRERSISMRASWSYRGFETQSPTHYHCKQNSHMDGRTFPILGTFSQQHFTEIPVAFPAHKHTQLPYLNMCLEPHAYATNISVLGFVVPLCTNEWACLPSICRHGSLNSEHISEAVV